MSDAAWYYDDAGRQAGPIGEGQLGELIQAARLAPRTRVWTAGMAGWQPWESIPALAAYARAGGPPPLDAAAAAPPFSGNSYAADVLAGPGALKLYPKAPFGSRFVAALIDSLISSIPAALLIVATVAAAAAEKTPVAVVLGVLAAVALGWAIWYSFTKDGRPGGQSIGKKAMGLMVVHLATNQPCNNGQSALRYLVLFGLNMIPYVGWLVEPIVTLAAAGGRRLGDSAAGTQVIAAAEFRPRG